jgi:hypothetical protein
VLIGLSLTHIALDAGDRVDANDERAFGEALEGGGEAPHAAGPPSMTLGLVLGHDPWIARCSNSSRTPGSGRLSSHSRAVPAGAATLPRAAFGAGSGAGSAARTRRAETAKRLLEHAGLTVDLEGG